MSVGTLFVGPTRLGDAVLVSGVLAWLAETYPQDPITLACGAPAAMALRAAPGLEALHVMRKLPGGRHWIALWLALPRRRWSRIVDLRRSAIAWTLRAAARHRIPAGLPGEHRVVQAARALGLPPQVPRVWLTEAEREAALRRLPRSAPVLALGPGANWICKTWPAEHFAALASRLTGPGGALADGVVLLVGSEAERAACRPIIEAVPAPRLVDALGSEVPATAALLARADLFVGNDSAMMHLAAAAGARTVGLFGPTRDEHYAPYGPGGLVVRTPESVEALLGALRAGGAEGTLMRSLRPEAVLEAIARRWPRFDAADRTESAPFAG